MSHAQEPGDFDLDEDLFDFAGVARPVDAPEPEEDLDEIFASFREAPPTEELLSVPVAASAAREAAPAPAPVEPVEPDEPRPASRAAKPRKAPEPAPVPHARTARAAEPAPEPAAPRAPAARPARLSKGLVAIALSVTLVNSLLALVVLRRGPASTDVRAVNRAQELAHESAEPAAHASEPEAALPDPDGVGVVHAHPALDEARAEIGRGEYAAARQRVYGLLAIIDRLEEPRRGALEADCQFLIAQSLHLEALARMGDSR